MNKLIKILTALTLICIGVIAFAPTAHAQTVAPTPTQCVGTIDADHTVAATNGHCILLSYRASGPTWETSLPQHLVDQDGPGTILSVDTVADYCQIDLVSEDATIAADLTADNNVDGGYYSTHGWLVDHWNGVCVELTPETVPSTTVPETTTTTVPATTTTIVPVIVTIPSTIPMVPVAESVPPITPTRTLANTGSSEDILAAFGTVLIFCGVAFVVTGIIIKTKK